jgi:hypothetical protein
MACRLLLDLISRTIRPQPRDGALELEQLEACLLQVLLEPRNLAVGDRDIAIPLLESGVGRTEQPQLHLAILGTAVDLLAHLAQLHLDLAEVIARSGQPLAQASASGVCKRRRVAGSLDARSNIVNGLLRLLHAAPEVLARRPALDEGPLALLQ